MYVIYGTLYTDAETNFSLCGAELADFEDDAGEDFQIDAIFPKATLKHYIKAEGWTFANFTHFLCLEGSPRPSCMNTFFGGRLLVGNFAIMPYDQRDNKPMLIGGEAFCHRIMQWFFMMQQTWKEEHDKTAGGSYEHASSAYH
jgi:hypothetical protein